VLAYDGDLAGRIEMEDAVDSDVGEIEAAVRRADGPFGEGETLLNEFALDAGSDHARNASCLRDHGRGEKRNQRSCRKARLHADTILVQLRFGCHCVLPWSC